MSDPASLQQVGVPEKSEQTLRDLLSMFFYKKHVVVGAFLGILTITALVALFSPPIYETNAELLVKPALTRPFMVQADSGTYFAGDVTLKDLNTVIFLMQSSEHLARVVKKLGMADAEQEVVRKEIARLKSRLKAEPLTESNVVRIVLRGGDPQEITRTLDALIESFVEYYIEINRIPGGLQFFRNQTEFLQRRLTQLNHELDQISKQNGVVDPAVQRQTLLGLVRDLEQERMKLLSSAEQIRSKVKAFEEVLRRFDNNKGQLGLPKSTVFEYPALIEMEKSLAQLTINVQRARNDYQPGAKPVQDAEAQLGNMRQQIRQYLRQIIDDLIVEEKNASQGLSTIEARISEVQDEAVRLTGKSLSYEQIKLERDIISRHYSLYADKQEEARIREAKDDARFANVSVAARPQLPAAPVFPRPILMIGLALLVGPLCALGLAAAAYLSEQRIYTPSEAGEFIRLLGTLDEKSLAQRLTAPNEVSKLQPLPSRGVGQ